jgi:hypothetical protein
MEGFDMGFRLTGLSADTFGHLADLSDAELRDQHVVRMRAEAGFPCRITLRDVEPGAFALLLNFPHHDVRSPYRASGPIFVSEGRHETGVFENEVPPEMRSRLYSGRAYDADGFMIEGDAVPGTELESLIERLLNAGNVSYLHLHHARRGCFACRVDRA